jgi:EmrB/QacA subfamily drug resistance transporter
MQPQPQPQRQAPGHPGTAPSTEPADDDAGRTGILVAMCLSLVLVVASVSSVNLALTGISLDLGTSSSQLTWIADGYTVALAALVLPFGALGDRVGRRTLLLVGTVVFGLAALAAAAAGAPGTLVGARVVMGIGAAMIMPGTLSTITAVFPLSGRAKAVSVWAGFASSGAILGLIGCGLILESWTWRATFLATAALSVVAFAAAWALTPNTADPEDAVIDLPGFVLSGVGIGALVYAIIDGAEAGWTTPNALGALTVAIASLAAFVAWELRTPRPMLDVRLFALRGFSTGALALTVQFLCLFGFFLVGLQFLLLVLGYSALHSALCLLPLAAIVMPLSRVAPHIVGRFGARAVMSIGLVGLGTGLAIMSRLDAASTYGHFLGGLAAFGLGMALTSTPATTAIVSSLPRAKQGVASAVNDVSRELGSALGIAMLGSLFTSGYSSGVSDAVDALPPVVPPEAAHAVEESAGAGFAVADRLGGGGGQQLADAVGDAFSTGLQQAMTAGAIFALVTAAVTLWRGPKRASAQQPEIDDATVPAPSVAAGIAA